MRAHSASLILSESEHTSLASIWFPSSELSLSEEGALAFWHHLGFQGLDHGFCNCKELMAVEQGDLRVLGDGAALLVLFIGQWKGQAETDSLCKQEFVQGV